MHRFLIVIEKAGRNYSAYAPDLPGCVATGSTRRQAEANMHAAIEMHLEGLAEDRQPVPTAHATSGVLFFEPVAKPTATRTRKQRMSGRNGITKR
ncbi:MAG: type II toxin-antitoxin system HicB family antitoxin [bacterium]|nr:type II toxin-antitoxin system HicB family antitoxin [bacterium]